MLRDLVSLLDWAKKTKARFFGTFVVFGNIAIFAAITVWLWPIALMTIIPVVELNERRAKFINVPKWIATSASIFFGLTVLMHGFVGLLAGHHITLPPWSYDLVGFSWVGVFGGMAIFHIILTLRYGSPYDEPGHPSAK